jgi:EAL domain-containing protein (putative c-di-GMP-specific phosphodiesterase class I)
MNEKLFDLAEEHGWIDDFGRWNFLNDDKLLRFAELVRQDERQAIFDILVDCSGRDDMSDSDESLLAYLAELIKERGEK